MNIKQVKLIALITVLTVCATACGQKQSKTTVGAPPAVAQNQLTEETITEDILSLPEMQFPHAAVMIVDVPTDAEPYFTVKGGNETDTHFATSFWFHVYTAPEYEIRLYDVVLDSEMTLAEWRNSKPKYDEVWENEEMSEYHKNLVFAKLKGKTGVINSISDEVVVPLIYDELTFDQMWDENWLLVLKEGKYGVIDFDGNTVLSLVYDYLGNSGWDAEWIFCRNGKWGLIEPGDKIIVPAEYDGVNYFTYDLASVKRNGKWGFINTKNELVIPYQYDDVYQQGHDGGAEENVVAYVTRDGERFRIDKNGKEIRIEN